MTMDEMRQVQTNPAALLTIPYLGVVTGPRETKKFDKNAFLGSRLHELEEMWLHLAPHRTYLQPVGGSQKVET